ncbi:MFS transporter [Myceligenerans pegani]|uniref:MFS transporter n=1 Tax=Myceligenerans pegani TaxID=2776917 RepID=A0ABR9N5L8_9MICO|nr:MFS transporter [Myceligenerans sp. TRM 65318]MBE1878957.1 MFS transporter [Myceligenerans sp. TRM 65318]MBE3021228.1 MFS transporter [Myceligenerans sp. TRM 65318]
MKTPPRDPAPRDPALPWSSLLVLGGTTLLMVTAEMLPTAVLGPMSAGLGVAESSTGMLVSLWAAVVVVASFPLVRLVRDRDRRAVVAGGTVVLAASSALTALAPTYTVAVGARLLGAAAVGLLWATVNAHVADLVPDRHLARAVAVVLGGATLGMVLGTPLARLVADAAGWRAAFWGLAALTAAAAIAVRLVVAPARQHRPTTADPGAPASPAARHGVAPLLAVTGLVALVLVGHYGAYTYITRLTEQAAAILPGGTGSLLLVFGLASAVGVALAGRFGERTEPALVAATAATGLTLAALAIDAVPALGVAVVAAWGVASGALPPLAQTLILRLAGPERRAFAGALIPVLFNGGIAAGAALFSALVATAGIAAVPVPAAAVVGAAAVGLGLAAGRRRAAEPRRAAEAAVTTL